MVNLLETESHAQRLTLDAHPLLLVLKVLNTIATELPCLSSASDRTSDRMRSMSDPTSHSFAVNFDQVSENVLGVLGVGCRVAPFWPWREGEEPSR